MENSIAIPVTASLLHNNLSSSDQRLAYVTNATSPCPQIHLIGFQSITNPEAPAFSTVKYNDSSMILYFNYVRLNQRWFLTIGLEQSMQIWTEDGNTMLSYVNKESIVGASNDTYFIGSCSCDDLNSILIGSSAGTITLMRVIDENRQIKIEAQTNLSSNRKIAISAIASYAFKAISCDEMGGVIFWDLRGNSVIRILENEGSGVSGTGICTIEKYACVGFGNGEVRIYDMNTNGIAFSVWSHTR